LRNKVKYAQDSSVGGHFCCQKKENMELREHSAACREAEGLALSNEEFIQSNTQKEYYTQHHTHRLLSLCPSHVTHPFLEVLSGLPRTAVMMSTKGRAAAGFLLESILKFLYYSQHLLVVGVPQPLTVPRVQG
jgi:hypothetical protein